MIAARRAIISQVLGYELNGWSGSLKIQCGKGSKKYAVKKKFQTRDLRERD
jgi:hypothetical protein